VKLAEVCSCAELGNGLHPALPSLSMLHQLTCLSVARCRPASSLKVLSSLISLKSLEISKWPFATNADCLGGLTRLTTLRLLDMHNLSLANHLSSLTDLQQLTVLECGSRTLTSFLWASRTNGLQSLQVLNHPFVFYAWLENSLSWLWLLQLPVAVAYHAFSPAMP
jgi:hypothetical protein